MYCDISIVRLLRHCSMLPIKAVDVLCLEVFRLDGTLSILV